MKICLSPARFPAVLCRRTGSIRIVVLALALALVGCDRQGDTGPVRIAAIGGRPVLTDPTHGAVGLPSRLLIDAVAQGLVRFDAVGQIEPGLAERWIVTDGGMSYIFRLREARWADGTPITAEQVVVRLRRQLAAGSRNPLLPFLTAIDEVVAMTPQIIEVRLKRARPDLLKLFAQPELGVLRASGGTGPMTVAVEGPTPVLRPLPDPDRPSDNDVKDEVVLDGLRASVAVARFMAGRADLVTGGTFADWPLVGIGRLPPTAVRVDPAIGLFGLSIVNRDGFLADPGNRAAIAQALDRLGITAVATGWPPEERLLPEQLDSAAPPQAPLWTALPTGQRRAAARAAVAAWRNPVTLRIALPDGPGATRLWSQIAAALLAVGITPERVAMTADADLRLLDAVAPYDSARWYLAAACQPCGPEAMAKVMAARDAPTMTDRAARIAEADQALAADTAFIPIAQPFRWSLVAPRLRAWQANARAWHPLNRLRADPT